MAWVMRQIGYETPRRAEITDRLRKSTKRWGVVRSGPSDVIVIDASNVESSYPALRRIPTTRVSARLSFGGGFRRLTLRRVAHLIVIVGVSAGIDRFRWQVNDKPKGARGRQRPRSTSSSNSCRFSRVGANWRMSTSAGRRPGFISSRIHETISAVVSSSLAPPIQTGSFVRSPGIRTTTFECSHASRHRETTTRVPWPASLRSVLSCFRWSKSGCFCRLPQSPPRHTTTTLPPSSLAGFALGRRLRATAHRPFSKRSMR